MNRLLFHIEDVFQLGDRGLVVVSSPGVAARGLAPGILLEFQREDGTWVRGRLLGLEMSCPNPHAITGLLVTNEIDRDQVPPGTGVWTRAEGVEVGQVVLETEAARAFGIEELRKGADSPGRVHSCLTPQKFVDSLWFARIQPSFHNHGLLAIVRRERSVRGLLLMAPSDPFAWKAPAAIDLSDWPDPVQEILESTPFLGSMEEPRPKSVTTDGIGYRLHVSNRRVEATLEFWNPPSGKYRALQEALLKAAVHVSDRQGDIESKALLATWQGYIDDLRRMAP